MYTNTHIHMSMFISEFCICIHVKNHGFIWIPPTPKKTVFIIAYFLIYNFLTQQRKNVLSLSTIYSLICSNSVCTKTVSEFLNNTFVRNTFTTQSTIFVLLIFSPRVHNQNPVFQSYLVPFFPTQVSVILSFISNTARFICQCLYSVLESPPTKHVSRLTFTYFWRVCEKL